ncbi:MAG: DUF6056 family protein [Endomicrobium sp.]|jgi:hypothetical protein|nr:DUF6056 family protein [Endomicrobium sp.]
MKKSYLYILPYLLLFLIFFSFQFFIPYIADDLATVATGKIYRIFLTLKETYLQWSSRLIIGFFGIIFIKYKLLGIFAYSALITLTAFCINYLFGIARNAKFAFISCALVLLYPFTDMITTGWYVSWINYLWPLCFMLIAFIPIKKIYEQKQISKLEYPVYILSVIIACNAEQYAGLILIVYLIFIIYLLKNKKINLFITVQFALIIAEILFILTCPGNEARGLEEANAHFDGFYDLTFFNRMEIAFSSSLYHFFFKPNAPFLMFLIILSAFVWQKHIHYSVKIVWSATAAVIFTLGYLFAFQKYAVYMYGARDAYIFILILLICFALAYLTVHAFKNVKSRLLCGFILLIGFASRMEMMLSPTVWASQTRTYACMNFSFIIASMLLFRELEFTNSKNKKIFYIILGALAFVSLLMFVVLVCYPPKDFELFYKIKQAVYYSIAQRYNLLIESIPQI